MGARRRDAMRQNFCAPLGCHRAMVTVVCMVDRSTYRSMRFVQANITMPPPCSPQDLPMWEKFTVRARACTSYKVAAEEVLWLFRQVCSHPSNCFVLTPQTVCVLTPQTLASVPHIRAHCPRCSVPLECARGGEGS